MWRTFRRFLVARGARQLRLRIAYGAMCCYGATFATQAAMAGVSLDSLAIRLALAVDFRTALGLGQFAPLSKFEFEVDVETQATDDEVQRVKQLADERCPAIWAMQNPVPFATVATKQLAPTTSP